MLRKRMKSVLLKGILGQNKVFLLFSFLKERVNTMN